MSDQAANEYRRIQLHYKKETETSVHFCLNKLYDESVPFRRALNGCYIRSGVRQSHRSMVQRTVEPDQFGNFMAMPLLRLNVLNLCRQPEDCRHLF
jgi:hypothetical protein